jgi:hypothetical protein
VAAVGDTAFTSPYCIAKNDAFPWFEVSPRSGVLAANSAVIFTVTLRPEKMTQRSSFRGAFLIRLESGLSLPVTVYAETDVTPEIRPVGEEAWITYLEAESTTSRHHRTRRDPDASGGAYLALSGPARENPVTYRFGVPEPGTYFIVLRVRSDAPVWEHDTIFFSVDDGPPDQARLRSGSRWTWSLAAHNRQMSLICLQGFELGGGEHVLRLAPQESLAVDLIAVTDNPGIFDTRWDE